MLPINGLPLLLPFKSGLKWTTRVLAFTAPTQLTLPRLIKTFKARLDELKLSPLILTLLFQMNNPPPSCSSWTS